jgi:hypothetical protein
MDCDHRVYTDELSKRRGFLEIDPVLQYGLKNPYRVRSLIEDAIRFSSLDLSGLVVITEAASRNYVVTPVIAAMAGARVYAVTSDSVYGKASDVEEITYNFAEFCNLRDKLEVIFEKRKEIVSKANIVTNLGFLRPINREFVDMMHADGVIVCLCEAWEVRKEDVDVDYCRKKGIPVMAVEEDYPQLTVFDFCGALCAKMLFELEIEIFKSKIVVVSRDRFGKTIEKYLKAYGADVYLVETLKPENRMYLKDCDALVTADYTGMGTLIGNTAHITAQELAQLSRRISVIQVAGDVDIEEIDKYGIPCFPEKRVGVHRMGMTLADLGPKPVIDLHCAGLKVGEVLARARVQGKSVEEAERIAIAHSPAQLL